MQDGRHVVKLLLNATVRKIIYTLIDLPGWFIDKNCLTVQTCVKTCVLFQVLLTMQGVIGSGLANLTYQTTYYRPRCSGLWLSKTVQIATYLILITFSLTGNVLLVAVLYRNKTLRTAVHYFIMNMAVSDLITPVLTLPGEISYVYHDRNFFVDGALGIVLCKFVYISGPVSAWVSIFSMIAIAATRFRAVLFPMKSAVLSRNKRRLIIASTWIASVALQVLFLYRVEVIPRHDTGLACTVQLDAASHLWKVLLITDRVLKFFLTSVSAIVLTVLYSSIITSLHRQKNNLHLANEMIRKRVIMNRKIAYMLVTIVVVFYIVWIPFYVSRFYRFFKPHIRFPCFFHWLAYRLPLMYPLVNPVVYYIFNKEYRQGFRELLCCPWPCANKCKECFQPSVSPLGENNVRPSR